MYCGYSFLDNLFENQIFFLKIDVRAMLTRRQSWRKVKPPKARFHESSDYTEADGCSKRVNTQLYNNKEYKSYNFEPREVVHRVARTVPEQVVIIPTLSAAGIIKISQSSCTLLV